MDDASSLSSGQGGNPFAGPAVSTVQNVAIRQHVPVVLCLQAANYTIWRSLFMTVFRAYSLVDHIDGSVDARLHLDDPDWTAIDSCIVNWVYTTISPEILQIIVKPDDTAHTVWLAVHNLFLGNCAHLAVYALHEFYNLYQGDLSITAYCSRLKQLADTLRDVGYPITDEGLVLNVFRGLRSDFSQSVTSMSLHGLPSFLNCRSFLEQEERRIAHTAALESNTALHARAQGGSRGSGAPASPSNNPGGGGGRGHQGGGGRRGNNRQKNRGGGRGNNTGGGNHGNGGGGYQPQGAHPGFHPFNAMAGAFQAWPLTRASTPGPQPGLLGPRPPPPPQAMYAGYAPGPSAPPSYSPMPYSSAPAWDQAPLIQALNNVSMQSSAAGSEWNMDTGASSHMSAHPGSSDQGGAPAL